jgi:hypothetical protein
MTTTRHILLRAAACSAFLALAGVSASALRLPNKGSVKFAVIGDMGTANRPRDLRRGL